MGEELDSVEDLPILPNTSLKTISVSWRNLQFLSSIGIVSWLRWVNQTSQSFPGVQIQFEHCNSIIANTIRVVDAFLPQNAVIVSFLVPASCTLCDSGLEKNIEMNFDSSISKSQMIEQIKVECLKGKNSTKTCQIDVEETLSFLEFLKLKDN